MANELADKYKGSVLICGSAPCLFDDFTRASKERPKAMAIAINDAASAVYADFLATLHPEDARRFRANSYNQKIVTLSGQRYDRGQDIDFWFEGCNSGGTTAGSAVKMARMMGFDEIILCGCPMRGGDGYFDARPKTNNFGMSLRFGNAMPASSVIRRHQKNLHQETLDGDFSMVKSMSGWTSELFGIPEFLKGKRA